MASGARPERDVAAARVQRVAVYALVRDDGDLLLTLLCRGPHAGMWTLPGGGMDFGERPVDALRRELWEETGLRLRGAKLLDADAELMRFDRDGTPVESHAIRLLYQAEVERGTPRVLEVGGSTAEARWVSPAERSALALTPYAAQALTAGRLAAEQPRIEG